MFGPFKKATPIRDLVMKRVEARIENAEKKHAEEVAILEAGAREDLAAIWVKLDADKTASAHKHVDSILP